jgi:hypothetical protein
MRAARADKATIEVDTVTDDADYRAVRRAVEHRIEAVSTIARASGLAVKLSPKSVRKSAKTTLLTKAIAANYESAP